MADRSVLRFPDGGWLELVGHHPALDLMNTVCNRRNPARVVDRIANAPAVLRWAGFAGVIGADQVDAFAAELRADPALGEDVVRQIHELRECLYQALAPLALGESPHSEDVATLQATLEPLLAPARWTGVLPLRWSVSTDSMVTLPTVIALQVRDLLEIDPADRLRECADDACGWLFLDRTKNASRRWCSSADCGNRAKVRRHYQRTRRSSELQAQS